jgi:hypothetical protein
LPLSAKAFAVRTEDSIYLNKDQTVDGNLYFAGKDATIDSPVKGDVIGIAKTITINAPVDGDVIILGQAITINAPVSGSIRVGGTNVVINGSVAHNVQAAGENIILGPDSTVGWDAFVNGTLVEARGHVLGTLHGNVQQINIYGFVGKDVNFNIESAGKDTGSLTLANGADVEGQLSYAAANPVKMQGAMVKGQILRRALPADNAKANIGGQIIGFLISLFAALLIALVILKISGTKLLQRYHLYKGKLSETALAGAILLIGTPIALIILCFTLIGIPLALISLVLWLIAIYIAQIIAGILLGGYLANEINKRWDYKLFVDYPYLAAAKGIALIWLLSKIPVIGCFITLAAIIAGLGFGWLILKKQPKKVS